MGTKTGGIVSEDALRYLREKVPMTAEEFKQLEEKARSRAFTVGGLTRLDLLQDMLNELRAAIEQGHTMQEFQQSIKSRMADKGWQGLTPYRIDTIFRTNVQTAYQVGRYQQMRSPTVADTRPYWMYDAVNDGATRPTHRAMDGMVWRYDDPIWDTWYPPNGFNCRCKVIALSPAAAERRGVQIQTGDLPKSWDKETGEILQMEPDQGFQRNAGQDAWQPDLSRYDPDLQNAYNQKSP